VSLDIVGFILFPLFCLSILPAIDIKPQARPRPGHDGQDRLALRAAGDTVHGDVHALIWGMFDGVSRASILTWARVRGSSPGGGLWNHDPGIYLMHYFAWVMGLCYRAHHAISLGIQHRMRIIPGVNAPRTCR